MSNQNSYPEGDLSAALIADSSERSSDDVEILEVSLDLFGDYETTCSDVCCHSVHVCGDGTIVVPNTMFHPFNVPDLFDIDWDDYELDHEKVLRLIRSHLEGRSLDESKSFFESSASTQALPGLVTSDRVDTQNGNIIFFLLVHLPGDHWEIFKLSFLILQGKLRFVRGYAFASWLPYWELVQRRVGIIANLSMLATTDWITFAYHSPQSGAPSKLCKGRVSTVRRSTTPDPICKKPLSMDDRYLLSPEREAGRGVSRKTKVKRRDIKNRYAGVVPPQLVSPPSSPGRGMRPQVNLAAMFGLDKMSVKLDMTDEAKKAIDELKEKIPDQDSIDMSVDNLGSMLEKLSDRVTLKLLTVVGMGVAGMAAIYTKDLKFKYIFGATALSLGVYQIYSCCDWFSALLYKVNNLEESDTQGSGTYLDNVATLMLSVIHWTLAKGKTSEGQIREFLKALPNFDRSRAGLSSIITWVISVFESCVNFVRNRILGWDSIQLLKTHAPKVDEWASKVLVVGDEYTGGKLPITVHNAGRLHNLINEGYQLISGCGNNEDGNRVRSVINSYMQHLRKIYAAFEVATGPDAGPRVEPVSILLMGAPGVGKTFSVMPFLKQLVASILPVEELRTFQKNFKEYMYVCMPENEYWEGYTGQFCTIFDDYLQIKDVAGQPDSEAMKTIRSINMFPYVLHMADVASKGKVHFTSKIVLGTTNMEHVNLHSINSNEAVKRRWKVKFAIRPRPEYCTPETKDGPPEKRRLDDSMLIFKDGHLHTEVYEFHLVDWDQSTLAVYDWDRALAYMVSHYNEKNSKYENYLTDLDSCADNIIAKRLGLNTQADVQMEETSFSEDWSDCESYRCILKKIESGYGFTRIPRLSMSLDEAMMHIFEHMFKMGRDFEDPNTVLATMHTVFYGDDPRDEDLRNIVCHPSLRSIKDERSTLVRLKDWLIYNIKETWTFKRDDSTATTVLKALALGGILRMCFDIFMTFFPNALDWLLPRYDTKLEAPTKEDLDNPSTYARFDGWFCRREFKGPYHPSSVWVASENIFEELAGKERVYKMPVASNGLFKKFIAPKNSAEYYLVNVDAMRSMIMSGLSEVPDAKPDDQLRLWKDGPLARMTVFQAQEMIASDQMDIATQRYLDIIYSNDGEALTPNEFFSLADDAQGIANLDVQSSYPMRKPGKKARRRAHPTPQAIDINACDQMNKIIRKSMFSIRLNGKHLGYLTFVRGNVALMPRHYSTTIKYKRQHEPDEVREYTLVNELTGLVHNVYEEDLIENLPADFSKSTDLVLVQFRGVAFKPDITNYFVSDEKKINWWDSYCALIRTKPNGTQERFFYLNPGRELNSVDSVLGVAVRISLAFTYRANTRDGDCGALLQLQNCSIGPGKIIGVHVAGDETSGDGISAYISKEMLLKALKNVETYPPPPETMMATQLCKLPFSGNFQPLFKLDKPVNQPTRTKLMKSLLYNRVVDSQKAPAVLHRVSVNGQMVDPLIKAIEGYGTVAPLIEDDKLRRVAHTITRSWLNNRGLGNAKPSIASFEEAVCGVEGDCFSSSIARNTSAGFPYVMAPLPGFKGKEYYFGKGEDYDLTRPEALHLKAMVLEVIEKAKRGERHFHVYVDTKKDELRSLDRVANAKTRLISAASLVNVLACRMYFMSFVSALMHRNVAWGSGVGINPFSRDWDHLARAFLATGGCFMAGDYSGFDKHHIMTICQIVCEMINQFYDDGEENARVRRVLFADLYNSVHVVEDNVYMWVRSLCSGHQLTTPTNTIINMIFVVYAFCSLHPEGFDAGLKQWPDTIKFVTYGDDVVICMSDMVRDWFNQHTIGEIMRKVDQTYTDESKGVAESVPKWRPITEITFLKRSFRYEERIGRWVAPLDLSSVWEMLNWVRECSNPNQTMKDNVDNVLKELSLHGRLTFEEWEPKITRASREYLGYYPESTDWAALFDKACAQEYFL